ncbi:MAG: alpha/beta hydrolase [Flavobacterium sp.]|uniref:alpha/beta fold hydrolase n=1 Tax=Flavobacterium sp. TaxID=239 RepID=UPI0011FEDC18|nr:alpha/beta hydrolase [Flavobacterium sp.]RZJ64370.1 MAG: alpha/beta hydrolase [Flavobacterium sp.]
MRNSRIRFKKRYVAIVVLLAYVVFCQSCMMMRFTPDETREFFTQTKVPYRDLRLVSDGHNIHYVETGDPNKPTLFFIHGSPGSWDAYRQYLSDSILLRKYRMIAVDRPGFGYSDFRDYGNLERNAQLLCDLAKKIRNGKPVTLVGHSLGGPIIIEMAADHPELFDKLVILAGSVDPNQEGNANWRKVVKAPPIRYLVPGAMRTSNDELTNLKKDLILLQPRIRSISADVVIIHGTEDPLVPFGNVAFLKKEFVNASSMKVIPIEGANHFIPWEHYRLIRDELVLD